MRTRPLPILPGKVRFVGFLDGPTYLGMGSLFSGAGGAAPSFLNHGAPLRAGIWPPT